ncbi:MAG: DUF1905 domain-containing protein [Aeromicrobium erythreum]
MDDATWTFDADLWRDGAWHFVTVPDDVSDEVEERFGPTAAGFGSVRVEVTVGATTWRTSVFPSAQQRAYVLPVKKAVRTAEGLDEGGTASFTLHVLAH